MNSSDDKKEGSRAIIASSSHVLSILSGGAQHLGYSHCPDNCPPLGASSGPKELYRLVENNPPQSADFLTPSELNKHPNADGCLRCSLSTYSSRRHADRLRSDVPFFRAHLVSAGTVDVSGGMMKRTGTSSGHWSWWPADGYVRHITFKVVP